MPGSKYSGVTPLFAVRVFEERRQGEGGETEEGWWRRERVGKGKTERSKRGNGEGREKASGRRRGVRGVMEKGERRQGEGGEEEEG